MTELKARYKWLNQKVKDNIITEKEISEMINILQEMSDDIKRQKNECIRIGTLEFRYSSVNQKYEIVQWGDSNDSCYVIAFLEKDSEGYNMRTVGDRMFSCDREDFWHVCYQALNYLNKEHDESN